MDADEEGRCLGNAGFEQLNYALAPDRTEVRDERSPEAQASDDVPRRSGTAGDHPCEGRIRFKGVREFLKWLQPSNCASLSNSSENEAAHHIQHRCYRTSE